MESPAQRSLRSPQNPTRVETLNYSAGGFHPVHLGDKFKKERYTVIHKLGHGGFATVWLARDSIRSRYVALKILAARVSKDCPEVAILRRLRLDEDKSHIGKEFVMNMLDDFWISGPNGRHLCVVSEVGGPSLRPWSDDPKAKSGPRRFDAVLARKIMLQAVGGLAFIHSSGIVHGDFTSPNILLKLANIDAWTVEEIYQRFGRPQTHKLRMSARHSRASLNSNTPRYTVNAINLKDIDPKWLSDQIMIIDFGISFLQDQPSEHIGTPKIYRAPEFLFDYPRSMNSDIWALGCTIFEVRTGSSLFQYKGIAPSRDQILEELVQVLGSLPPSWLDKWELGRMQHIAAIQKSGILTSINLGNLHTLIMGVAKVDTIRNSPDLEHKKSLLSTGRKDAASAVSISHSYIDNTDRLIELVECLATEEAADILRSGFQSNSTSGSSKSSQSTSSNTNSPNAKNGEMVIPLGGSSSLEDSSTWRETRDAGRVGEQAKSVTTDDIDRPKISTTPLGSFYLEATGTVISELEAKGLEDLLRRALRFQPDERIALSELAEHSWFSDDFEPKAKVRLQTVSSEAQNYAMHQSAIKEREQKDSDIDTDES